MIPSRLQFTIKMLNVLIIFKNNFFLTFLQSESVRALAEISQSYSHCDCLLFIICNYTFQESWVLVSCIHPTTFFYI